jgi:hypothetical protein
MAKSQPVPLPQTVNSLGSDESEEPDDVGRWVTFEYCISLIAVTLRRTSRPIYLKPGQEAWLRSLPYVGVSLLLGWWGLPWGAIYTPVTIFANLTGGCDITAQVRDAASPGS